jgi:hypothetical protein
VSVTIAPITRNGRRVVLKRLDDDCMLDGQLHPSIRLRLERVRELPVKCVANLIGVERDEAGVANLVWEYLPGTPLADARPADWARMSREVVLAVQSLNAAGIVHGAIHARNVIVDDAKGEVWLTHVSPLLYSDPDNDAADTIAMLDTLVNEQASGTPLASLLAEMSTRVVTLEELYVRLSGDAVEPATAPQVVRRDARRRTRLFAAAVLIAAVGIATSLAIYWRVTAGESKPYATPVARNQ